MAKVSRKGNSFRVRRMVNGTTYSVCFDHNPTKHEIEAAFKDKMDEKPSAGSVDTFKACAERFIEVNDGGLSPNTIKEYKGTLRRIPKWFLNTPVKDIDELTAQKVVSEYAKAPANRGGVKSVKTVKNYWDFISVVLKKSGKPAMQVNVSGRAQEDDYMPTEEDIKKLLKQVKGTKIEIPVKLSAFGSLREGEILGLEMSDVKDGMVHINKALYYDNENKEWKVKPYPKNDASIRYAPIPEALETLIRETGYIYPHKPNALRRAFSKACEKAGIPHFRFHRLRAYYSSALHAASVPDKYIMARGGWKTDAVLKKNYQRALADKQSEMDAKSVQYFEGL